jgi:hypothetical protein
MPENHLDLHGRCPWCGSVPQYTEEGIYSQHPERFHLWHVGCPNIHCPVQPKTRGFHEPWQAVEAWDRRFDILEELHKREAGVA